MNGYLGKYILKNLWWGVAAGISGSQTGVWEPRGVAAGVLLGEKIKIDGFWQFTDCIWQLRYIRIDLVFEFANSQTERVSVSEVF